MEQKENQIPNTLSYKIKVNTFRVILVILTLISLDVGLTMLQRGV